MGRHSNGGWDASPSYALFVGDLAPLVQDLSFLGIEDAVVSEATAIRETLAFQVPTHAALAVARVVWHACLVDGVPNTCVANFLRERGVSDETRVAIAILNSDSEIVVLVAILIAITITIALRGRVDCGEDQAMEHRDLLGRRQPF